MAAATRRRKNHTQAAADLYLRQQANEWHLDKRIPLALIVTILAQTMGAIWWAAVVTARIDQLETGYKILQPQGERLTRVEDKITSIEKTVDQVSADVKQILIHSGPPVKERR